MSECRIHQGWVFEAVWGECTIPNDDPFGKENKAAAPLILFVKVSLSGLQIYFYLIFLFIDFRDRRGRERE